MAAELKVFRQDQAVEPVSAVDRIVDVDPPNSEGLVPSPAHLDQA